MEASTYSVKVTDMEKKGLNKYPFIVQVISLPIVWVIAILKILVTIPVWIVAKCNSIMEKVG